MSQPKNVNLYSGKFQQEHINKDEDYQKKDFKKWTEGNMDLPPLVDIVENQFHLIPNIGFYKPQSLIIFVNFHLAEDDDKYHTSYFVCQDNLFIYQLKKKLQENIEIENFENEILLYNKTFLLENHLTMNECNIKNNAILDAWLDSMTKIKINFIVIQYGSRIELRLVLSKFACFSECMAGVMELIFKKQMQHVDLLTTILLQDQRISFYDLRTLKELGIKNGSSITIVVSDKHACFPENTLITMKDGSKKIISSVSVGDEIMSYDLNQMVFKPSKIIYRHYGNAADFILVQTKQNIIKTTAKTPFLTIQGWKAVFPDYQLGIQELTTEDLIFDENQIFQQIISIQSITEKHSQYVFNFTLEAKSLFVANGFVVLHNNFNAQVRIKNQIQLFEITEDMMVHNIKGMIYMKHGIKIEDQEIYYNEMILEDECLLLDQTKNEIIQLTMIIKNQNKEVIEEKLDIFSKDPNLLKIVPFQEKKQFLEIHNPININFSDINQEQEQKGNLIKEQKQGGFHHLFDAIKSEEMELQKLMREIELRKELMIKKQENIEKSIKPIRKQQVQEFDESQNYEKNQFPDSRLFQLRKQQKPQEDTISIRIISNIRVCKIKIRKNLPYREFCRILYNYINLPTTVKSSILYNGTMYEMTNPKLKMEDLNLVDQATLILLTGENILSAFQFTYCLLGTIQLEQVSELENALTFLNQSMRVRQFIEKQIIEINSDSQKQWLYQQFQLHHLLAIKIQSSNLVYKTLNIDLRTQQIQKWVGYLQFLMQAIRYCSFHKGMCFRGVKYYQGQNEYQVDNVVQFSEVSSFTKDIEIAKLYANTEGMLIQSELISAKDIEKLSIHEDEKEILIQPYSCFTVVSVTENANEPNFIILKEVPLPRATQILFWIDDNPENNYQYAEELQKENKEISVVFCTSTKEALKTILSYSFMMYLDESNIRIVTDMVRHEDGEMNYYAGISFIKQLIENYQFDYQVLVFCQNVNQAKQSFKDQNVIGNYIISKSSVELMRFIRFQ